MITIIKPEILEFKNIKKGRDKYVVTHDGLFHSDEVFAIALLKLFHKNINIVRTRDSEILKKAKKDSNVFVLDIGGDYNTEKKNFDHHQKQSPSDQSTIIMVFKYLFPYYKKDEVLLKLRNRLISGINAWDLGKIDRNISNTPLYLPQVISAFNRFGTPEQDYQFIKAIDFAEQVIANEINTAKELLEAEKIWNNRTMLDGDVALLNKHCAFWRSIQGDNPKVKFIIQPSGKNWSVLSVNSQTYPLPYSTNDNKPIFEHKNRFITIYKNLSSALKYVIPIV